MKNHKKPTTSAHNWIPKAFLIASLALISVSARSAVLTVPAPYTSIQSALTAANSGDTIEVAAGTLVQVGAVNINKSITLKGAGASASIIQIDNSDGANVFTTSAPNIIIEDLHFQKIDNGAQHLIYLDTPSTNLIVRDNKFSGIYDPETNLSGTSRAFLISTAGFQILNNEITNLRQPGYINPAATTGLIQGNHIANTRGWVIEEGNVTFEDNTWGELSDSNYLDIVILNTVDVPNYPDVVALSVANSEAVVEDQRPGTGPSSILSTVFVDGAYMGAYGASNGTPVQPYTTINSGMARVVTGGFVKVISGTYNVQVAMAKSLTLKGTGPTKPIFNFTGTVSGKPAVIDVSVPNVTVENFQFDVDFRLLSSAIIASGASIDGLEILDNIITPYASSTGASFGSYGTRNAISMNYGAYRVAGGSQLFVSGNVITGRPADDPLANGTARFFRAGISADDSYGEFTDNTVTAISQDIEARFVAGGDVLIADNELNGGGVEIAEPNPGATRVSIEGNQFNGTTGSTYTSSLRIRNNEQNKPVSVVENVFAHHNWGISVENFRNLTIARNTFSPLAGSSTYRHITVNTKSLSTNSASIVQVPVSATITNNVFSGSVTPGGAAISFYNHDSDNASFGSFTVFGNSFESTLGKFIVLDESTGSSTSAPAFPEYNLGGGSVTTLAPWTALVNASGNEWSTTVTSTILSKITGSAPLDFTPSLASSTDTDAMTAGFQGDFTSLVIQTAGAQTNAPAYSRVQEAIDLDSDGGQIMVPSAAFPGNVDTTSRSVNLLTADTTGQVTLQGNLTLDATDTLSVEINGLVAGVDFDQWLVEGVVTLGGANLAVTGSYVPLLGESFLIVGNDMVDPTVGLFNGIAEGGAIPGFDTLASYAGGDGNDVELTAARAEIVVEEPVATDIPDGGSRDFGTVAFGGVAERTFTVNNIGTIPLTGLSISFSGTDAGLFSVVSPPSAPVAATSGSTSFTVRFAPTTGGTKSATIQISSNDTDESPFDILLTGTCGSVPGTFYFNGFENNLSGWTAFGGSFTPTRVASGTGGINSATGGFHALNSASGSAGNWGGYNFGAGNAVPTTFREYRTAVSVYLNVEGGWANNTRFDFSSAINNAAGTHLRDFIFNAGFYNDATGPGANTNRFVVSASNGSQPGSAFAKNPDRDPIAISTTGWYVFEHHFYENAGVLAVDLFIKNSSGTLVKKWTLSNPVDVIANVGGNRYGWFAYNQFSTLAFDNAELTFFPEIAVEQPALTQVLDGGTRDFGSVNLGASNELEFTVSNTGIADLTGLVPTIDGPDASVFAVTVLPLAPVAAPSGTTTFKVLFAPVTGGAKSAVLHLANNDRDEAPFDITLTGTGVTDSRVLYANGFENNISGWTAFGASFTPTRVASGTGGINSATGGFHALSSASGSAGNWGGYNFGAGNAVPTTFREYRTAVSVYLNVEGGWVNNTRFDFSSAINNAAGTHLRDFIFNAGFYNDATGPGANTNRFVVSASNGSQPSSAFAKNPDRDPIAISTTGWYVFEHHFYDNAGVLAVDLFIKDSSGTFVKKWTLSNPGDVIANVGGNRYGWFAYNQFSTLAFDNAELTFFPEIAVELAGPVNVLDGGSANLGSTAPGGFIDTTFTIKNTGIADLEDLTVTFDGTDSALFSVLTPAVAPIVAPTGTSDLVVRFTGSTPGVKAAVLHIANNDRNEAPYDINLSATVYTSVVTGGDLVIGDANLGNASDNLILSLNGANLRITDPDNTIVAGPGATQINANTIEVALASLTGQIIFNGQGQNDRLTLDYSGGDFVPSGGVVFNGGDGSDLLRVIGNGLVTVYTPDDAVFGAGELMIAGKLIAFSGLEPVDYDVSGGSFTLNLPNADDVVNVQNAFLVDGTTPALELSGTTGGVSFETARVRGSSIVINTTTLAGADTVTITSANNLHTNTALTVNAGTEAADVISVNGLTTFSGTVTLNARRVDLAANVTNAVTGSVATLVNVTTPGQIQDGVNVAAASGATVNVGTGTYSEQVVIAKSLILDGALPKPEINFTGPLSGKATLIDVSAPDVTIRDFALNVDFVKLSSAIIATGVSVDGLQVLNNDIAPYGSSAAASFGSYGNRNAISVNYAGFRVTNGGGEVTVMGNTISGRADTDALSGGVARYFRAGLGMDECYGSFTGNTVQTINHDFQARFGSTGSVLVENNIFNGGGANLAEQNTGVTSLMVVNNTFNGAASIAFNDTAMLRLQNNQVGIPTTVSGNTFTGHEWGVSLENYRNAVITGNSFTPALSTTNYRHITVNTKSLSSNSGSIVQTTISTEITNNIFNGSGVLGGVAVAFYNHDSDAAALGVFTLGTALLPNAFNDGIGTYVLLDHSTGNTFPAPPAFPYYGLIGGGAASNTVMAPWSLAIDASNNLFDVGSGPALPSALTITDLFIVEDRVQHKVDTSVLGLVRIKANELFVTTSSFVAPTTTEASIQRGVDAAVASEIVNVNSGSYTEDVTLNKTLTLKGQSAANTIIVGKKGGLGVTVQIAASGATLEGFTITREGNTVAEWNDGSLNNAGVAIQGLGFTGNVIRNNIITGNRSAVDINNSNGHSLLNNVIRNNHTGLIFRNQTDNLLVEENIITENRTVGVLFLDASGGTNSPVQSAAGSVFSRNSITGNWYGQVVDRQAGGSLPAPGTTNLKNFSANWFGSTSPLVTTANSAEPGYAALIPVTFGGTAVAPGGQPDIAGPAAANVDYSPLLVVGTDTDVESSLGRGTLGFQGSFAELLVFTEGSQTGSVSRVQEAVDLVNVSGLVTVETGSYPGSVDATSNAVTLRIEDAALVGQVTLGGNLSLDANDSLPVQINGTAPGTLHDQWVVNGLVSLAGAALPFTGTHTPAPGDVIILLSNDDVDSISGSFAGLGQGATIPLFLGSSYQAFASYVVGTGNDFALAVTGESEVVLTAGDLTITDANGGATADRLTLSVVGANLRVNDPFNTVTAGAGAIQVDANTVEVPFAMITGTLSLNTLALDDIVTLDFVNGSPIPGLGLSFDGGTSTDAFRLVGSAVAAIYTPSATTDGFGVISVGGKAAGFSNIEGLDYSVVSGTFTLSTPGAVDVLDVANGTLFDAVTPALVLSGTSGGVTIESARVRGSAINIDTTAVAGADILTITSADNAHENTALSLNAGTEVGDLIDVNGTTTVSGAVTLDALTVNLDANITNAVSGTVATTVNVSSPGQINDGVSTAALTGATVNVAAATYPEDVSIAKSLVLSGAGAVTTIIEGPVGGDGATVRLAANNVTLQGFTITRFGNTVADWNNPNLNSAGIAIQGLGFTGSVIRNNIITGNRSAVDINNSNGHSLLNNVINNNHTGLIFRNQTDNLLVEENIITENRTVGVLFLDASAGTNSPVQSVAGSVFSRNSITGNWYGQVVDRQAGGSLPAPGTTNLKNFSANWFGSTSPLVTTANSAEPGYAALIPVTFGGTAVAPGGQPDIAGPAAANVDYSPLLVVGTDTDVESSLGRGTFGFQGSFAELLVVATNAQSGTAGRIHEAAELVNENGLVTVPSSTYSEDVLVTKLGVTITGAGSLTTIIEGPAGGDGATVRLAASNVTLQGFTITRFGNTVADWNNPNLNSAGIAIQGLGFTGSVIRNNIITGNRSAVDINNSNGHSLLNNVIRNNHTGLIFRNQTDNLLVEENIITENRTVGVLFLDASSGTNSPVQSAAGSVFSRNSITSNWYGQVVDRQAGGSLPAPGTTNLKNFSANWFGSTSPLVTTANSAEPGYAALIPVVFGGTAVAPGGQPDIAGPAAANVDYSPLLVVGTDTDVESSLGRGTLGFQGSFEDLWVTSLGAQVGSFSRIQEGVDRLISGGELTVLAGTYPGNVSALSKAVTFHTGAGADLALITVGGNVTFTADDILPFLINGTTPGSGYDQWIVNGTLTLGGATLNLLSDTYEPDDDDDFILFSNDDVDLIGGTFAGRPQDAIIQNFFVGTDHYAKTTYVGGDGNDFAFEVDGEPLIITQPAGLIVEVYDPFSLSVVAIGRTPFSYQWYLEGNPLSNGSAATFTDPAATIGDKGNYTVEVFNELKPEPDGVLSDPAFVNVVPKNVLVSDMTLPLADSGNPGALLGRPLTGVISPTGKFAVQALAQVGPGGITAGNDQMILTNVSGSVAAIGREGMSLGGGASLSRLFYYMNATSTDSVVYRAVVNGLTGASDTAYFISPDGAGLEILSQEGDEAPEGAVYFTGHISPHAVAEDGVVYFDSRLTGAGITSRNESGVWYDADGDIDTLAREGELAPTGSSVADQSWYSQITAGSVVAGGEQASFIAELQDDPLNPANKTDKTKNAAVFTGSPTMPTEVVLRKGDQVSGVTIQGFNAVSVSRDGHHVANVSLRLGGTVTGNNSLALIYKPEAGPAEMIAQKGQTLADAGDIVVFERLFIAEGGQVIFEVTLNNPSSSDGALCRWTPEDGIEVLVQEGDASPGGGVYGALRSVAVSPAGNILYQDTRAIWRDLGDGMELLIKNGDTVFVSGNPFSALSLSATDETFNTRRAGGGFSATINDDGAVITVISIGGGDYVTQLIP